MNYLKSDWDRSYSHGDNFIFYPHEEVIRFFARNVRKRVGIDTFKDQDGISSKSKILDLGCGIGRHVRFCDDMKLEAYGIDLSEVAIAEAKNLCKWEGRHHLIERFQVGSITKMTFTNDTFDVIISHGVLDSMDFEFAKAAILECRRILKQSGKFYLDLISGDDQNHWPEFAGEEHVSIEHEKNTIQSYFNFARIQELIQDQFALEECRLVQNRNMIGPGWYGRYHIVLTQLDR
tara:strand:- start:155 stop:856 length:702 start_codon:yes stop_codon:yes gene_type:complete